MSQRDLQSELAAIAQSIAAQTAADTYVGATIDLRGARSFITVITPSRAVGADDVTFIVQESDDSASGFTTVSQDKILPTRNQATGGQELFDPTAPYSITFGAIDTKRYVRVGVVIGATITSTSFEMVTMIDTLQKPFLDYDSTITLDGLP